MPADAVYRKLAAILSADAVGYSRLMARDEKATLETLNAHRDAMGGLVRQHGGRVANAVGDNILAEFRSVVDAVGCAIEIQRELLSRNAGLTDERQMEFRIGIHLGDVMVEGEHIYGDGINIAARLEGLAEPGGICISGTVQEQVQGKLSAAYEDLGTPALKNIATPVRVYRVRAEGAAVREDAAAFTVPGFAGRPAIAVLPFDNLSGDPEQDYFADGIAEDLITRLSSFRFFPVIARNSSFVYKGKAVDVKQAGRGLGARYLVEGSVRRAAERVRITAQLIEATTGHHIWAKRYDRELQDLFALQDEISETIFASLEPALFRVEQSRAMRRAPENLDAWDCVQRGLWHLFRYTKDDTLRAQALFRRACELDPRFSPAFSGLAGSHVHEIIYQWTDSPALSLAAALRAAETSVGLDEEDPIAHTVLGWACSFRRQDDRAIAAHERAIELNPSVALAYSGMCYALVLASRPEDAIRMVEKAIRLSPHDPLMHYFLFNLAQAQFVAERYEEAVLSANRSLQLRPDHPAVFRLLAACLGHLGRAEDGKAALETMFRLAPGFSVATFRLYLPPAIVERYLDGWGKTGWKE